MPEARVIGLPETPAGGLLASGVEQLAPRAACCSAVLAGGSVILDALAMDVVLQVPRFDQPVLLTPHAGGPAGLSGPGNPARNSVGHARSLTSSPLPTRRRRLESVPGFIVRPGPLPSDAF